MSEDRAAAAHDAITKSIEEQLALVQDDAARIAILTGAARATFAQTVILRQGMGEKFPVAFKSAKTWWTSLGRNFCVVRDGANDG